MQRPAGFSRRHRLTTASEFGRVFADPTRSTDRYFTVLSRVNDEGLPRLGLTVSKRVAKHAFARNRLKRIAREAFRQHNGLPSADFVVMAKTAAPGAVSSELRASLERHFERIAERTN